MKPKYHSAKTVLAPLQRLRSEGITVAQALAGTGLSLSILERPEQHVSLSQELIFLPIFARSVAIPVLVCTWEAVTRSACLACTATP